MEILIILLLIVVVVLIVGYPLVNAEKYREPALLAVSGDYDDLYGARETVFEALRDLQFEYATGKLSANDYTQLKSRYEVQAADILSQIDAVQAKNKNVQGKRACPRCNTVLYAQDKFCAKCGAKL